MPAVPDGIYSLEEIVTAAINRKLATPYTEFISKRLAAEELFPDVA